MFVHLFVFEGGGLKHQKCILMVLEARSPKAGVGGVMFSLKALGENPSLFLSVSHGNHHFFF